MWHVQYSYYIGTYSLLNVLFFPLLQLSFSCFQCQSLPHHYSTYSQLIQVKNCTILLSDTLHIQQASLASTSTYGSHRHIFFVKLSFFLLLSLSFNHFQCPSLPDHYTTLHTSPFIQAVNCPSLLFSDSLNIKQVSQASQKIL